MDASTPPELWLRTILIRNGLQPGSEALELIKRYVAGLLEANKVVNLISRKDEERIWSHHILHSVSALFALRFPENCRVLDLGTGGGLPGIPLKIFQPSIQLTLLDATNKKVSAVRTILAELHLEEVGTVWGRAEVVGRSEPLKGSFDIVVARAVGPLDELVRLAHPFLRRPTESAQQQGNPSDQKTLSEPCLVAYKGGEISHELEKARRIRYVRSVQARPLAFRGAEEFTPEQKLIVVVEFN